MDKCMCLHAHSYMDDPFTKPIDNMTIESAKLEIEKRGVSTYFLLLSKLPFSPSFQNLRLDTAIPRDFFDILDMSLNGSYFYIRPKKIGHPSFFSSFNKLVHPDNGSIVTLSSTLTQQQPMVIYGPVVVEVNPVVILWYAAVAEGESTAGRETYSYQLQAGSACVSVCICVHYIRSTYAFMNACMHMSECSCSYILI